MDAVRISKQAQSDAMNRSVAPALVEEAACAVKVLEVCFVFGRAPEVHVSDLEVAPEVTSGVSVGLAIVFWSSVFVGEPVHRVWLGERVLLVGQEAQCLRP